MKKTTPYDIGNPVPGLQQTQKCGGGKPVNGITSQISKSNRYRNKTYAKTLRSYSITCDVGNPGARFRQPHKKSGGG